MTLLGRYPGLRQRRTFGTKSSLGSALFTARTLPEAPLSETFMSVGPRRVGSLLVSQEEFGSDRFAIVTILICLDFSSRISNSKQDLRKSLQHLFFFEKTSMLSVSRLYHLRHVGLQESFVYLVSLLNRQRHKFVVETIRLVVSITLHPRTRHRLVTHALRMVGQANISLAKRYGCS